MTRGIGQVRGVGMVGNHDIAEQIAPEPSHPRDVLRLDGDRGDGHPGLRRGHRRADIRALRMACASATGLGRVAAPAIVMVLPAATIT